MNIEIVTPKDCKMNMWNKNLVVENNDARVIINIKYRCKQSTYVMKIL